MFINREQFLKKYSIHRTKEYSAVVANDGLWCISAGRLLVLHAQSMNLFKTHGIKQAVVVQTAPPPCRGQKFNQVHNRNQPGLYQTLSQDKNKALACIILLCTSKSLWEVKIASHETPHSMIPLIRNIQKGKFYRQATCQRLDRASGGNIYKL